MQISKYRAYRRAIRAADLFKTEDGGIGDFAIGPEQLASMTRDRSMSALQKYGGVEGLSGMIKTNLDKGITGYDADLLNRRNAFGSNTYPRKKGRSFLRIFWEACQNLTLIILMVAAVCSLALGIKMEGSKEGWYYGGSIAFAVVLVTVVTAFIDYQQFIQFQNLNKEKRNMRFEVVRGGKIVEVSIHDIVVGDVVLLKVGDQVPADGVLISGHSLAIAESSGSNITIVHKYAKESFLISGCKVADGSGIMLVTSVGINTEWGLLMSSISERTGEQTPFQVQLNGVATFIGFVGLAVAFVALVILLVRYFTGHTKNGDGTVQFVAGKTEVGKTVDGVIRIFTVAVTIVVVAVPEGLPLAVTSNIAYVMRKMMADKVLLRRLSACETMGFATTICSDKAGTLTLYQMTVIEAYVGGKKIDPPDSSSQLSRTITSLLIEGIAQNSNSSCVLTTKGGRNVEVSGSLIEKAILNWGIKLGMNFDSVRSESSIIRGFPFNSEKKRSGVAVRLPDSTVHIHWKGAPEIVLAACTQYLDGNDNLEAIDEEKGIYFRNAIEDMASRSLCCVAIAYRSYESGKVPTDEEKLSLWHLPENNLILLAIIGIKVCMVTGDSITTAKAIALECGILESGADTSEANLIEGKVFRSRSDAEREEIVDKIRVMGRSSPNDKLLLVQALRRRGHVVAVIGRKTTDSPALQEADIGISMGISGEQVAKESSGITILDNSFCSVVEVVGWGRSLCANIQKCIQFQLTVIVAALVINVVSVVSSGEVPLNAVQLLWVNLLVDTLGVLALATESPTGHLMQRPPVGRREPLITNIMLRNLLIQAIYQVTILLVVQFRGKSLLYLENHSIDHANKVKNTLIFNSFVLCQVFNEFNSRKPDEKNIFKGLNRNSIFIGVVFTTVVLQAIVVEFLGKYASTVKLSWKLWLVSIAIGIISWPLAFIGKLIPVPEIPFRDYMIRIFLCGRRAQSG